MQATQPHGLLAQSFWEAQLRMEEKFFFPRDRDESDFKDGSEFRVYSNLG